MNIEVTLIQLFEVNREPLMATAVIVFGFFAALVIVRGLLTVINYSSMKLGQFGPERQEDVS